MSDIFPELNDRLSGTFPEMVKDTSHGSAPRKGSPTAVTLNVVRHTSTDIDDAGKSHGWLDPNLNEKGVREAEAMARKFKGVPVDKIYTSDTKRAQQTGHFIAGHTAAKVEPQFGLRPINMGQMSGHTHEENEEAMHKLHEKWKADTSAKVPGGESFADFENRNLGTIQSILQGSQAGDHVALVGHSITAALLKGYAKAGKVSPLSSNQVQQISNNESSPMFATYSYNPETRAFSHG